MTKTESIFKLTAPYNNEYQGDSKRIVCVCSVGILRSPTLANVLIKQGYNVRACGSCIELALIPLSANLINWAHKIIFINSENYDEALRKFADTAEHTMIVSKSLVLDINDSYDYNQYTLIKILKTEVSERLNF